MPLGEFDVIDRYFSRSSTRRDVLLGVGDDAAVLIPPAGQALVAATDTLVEGRHFLPGTVGRHGLLQGLVGGKKIDIAQRRRLIEFLRTVETVRAGHGDSPRFARGYHG